jgi:RNA polymerase sigma-70 factor (ECF subfamily)
VYRFRADTLDRVASSSLGRAIPSVPPRAAEDANVTRRASDMTFAEFYDAHASFVLRNVRRLVGADGPVDDLVQEVFLAVAQRLGEFQGRSTMRTWVYGILRNIVGTHWRSVGRGGRRDSVDLEILPDAKGTGPDASMEKAQAFQVLHELLVKMDEAKRDVFVLAELEQMSAPEIADALGINQTTVYARLRDARRDFELLAQRHHLRTQGRPQ